MDIVPIRLACVKHVLHPSAGIASSQILIIMQCWRNKNEFRSFIKNEGLKKFFFKRNFPSTDLKSEQFRTCGK